MTNESTELLEFLTKNTLNTNRVEVNWTDEDGSSFQLLVHDLTLWVPCGKQHKIQQMFAQPATDSRQPLHLTVMYFI